MSCHVICHLLYSCSFSILVGQPYRYQTDNQKNVLGIFKIPINVMLESFLCKSCGDTLIYSYQFTSPYKTFQFRNRSTVFTQIANGSLVCNQHTNNICVYFAFAGLRLKSGICVVSPNNRVTSRFMWPVVCGPMATTCPYTRANSIDLYGRYVFTIKCDSITYSLSTMYLLLPFSYAFYSAFLSSTESGTFPLV